MIDRSPDNGGTSSAGNGQLRELRRAIATLDADGLAEVIALAYARLEQDDPRTVRKSDIALLRRLARQAHDFDSSLIEHAAQRRRVGERRGMVAPEAAHTAEWANRLADALDSLVTRTTPRGAADDARIDTKGKS